MYKLESSKKHLEFLRGPKNLCPIFNASYFPLTILEMSGPNFIIISIYYFGKSRSNPHSII